MIAPRGVLTSLLNFVVFLDFLLYLLSQSPVWLEARVNLGVLTLLLPVNPAVGKLTEITYRFSVKVHIRKYAGIYCINYNTDMMC